MTLTCVSNATFMQKCNATSYLLSNPISCTVREFSNDAHVSRVSSTVEITRRNLT